jgi:hypothetical protein
MNGTDHCPARTAAAFARATATQTPACNGQLLVRIPHPRYGAAPGRGREAMPVRHLPAC